MSSSSTQPSTPEDSGRRADHQRLQAARKALLWLGVVVLAIFPFPWWW